MVYTSSEHVQITQFATAICDSLPTAPIYAKEFVPTVS